MNDLRLRAIFSLIDRVTGPMRRINQATDFMRKKMLAVAGALAAVGAAAFGAGLAFLGKGVWDTSKQFENYTATLRVMLGTQEKANAAMDWIEGFARRTPYDLAQVTEAYQKLVSYGIDPQTRAMASLGNGAAGMGKQYNDAIEAMADATSGEFERLKEFGIRSKTVGNEVIFSYDQAGKEVAKKVKKSSAEIQGAILDIFDTKFPAAMDALSQTGAGIEDNIKGWFTGVQKLIGKAGVYEHIKTRLNSVMETLAKLEKNGQLAEWAKKMSDAMIKLFDAVDKLVSSIDWVALVTFLTNVTVGVTDFVSAMGGFGNIVDIGIAAWIGSLVMGLTSLIPLIQAAATAFGVSAATVAAMGGPITLVIAVVAALAAGAYLLWRNWDKVSAWFGGIWDQVVAAWSGVPGQISGFFSGLWDNVKSIFSGFIDWISDNFMSFPLPLKILALPALLIKNWDTVKGWFTTAWAWIQKTWSGLPWWMQALINLPATIITHWNDIRDWFTKSWAWVQKVWSGLPWWMQALINLPATVITHWDSLKQGMADLWARIAEIWSGVSEWFAGVWNDIKAAFIKGADDIWNALPEWLQNVLKGVAFGIRFITGGPDLTAGLGKSQPQAAPRPLANTGGRVAQEPIGGAVTVGLADGLVARKITPAANTRLTTRTDLGMQTGGR